MQMEHASVRSNFINSIHSCKKIAVGRLEEAMYIEPQGLPWGLNTNVNTSAS